MTGPLGRAARDVSHGHRRTSPRGALCAERGAATVEFALVSVVLVLLFLVTIQVGYALHVRNTATAHVIEGARVGARADNSPEDGVARASQLLETTLPGSYGTTVHGERLAVDGIDVVRVSAELPLPVLGPLGVPGSMTVTGQAYAEGQ